MRESVGTINFFTLEHRFTARFGDVHHTFFLALMCYPAFRIRSSILHAAAWATSFTDERSRLRGERLFLQTTCVVIAGLYRPTLTLSSACYPTAQFYSSQKRAAAMTKLFK
jgi:hypothetical protein